VSDEIVLFRLAARPVRLALVCRRDLPAKAYERLVNDADPEVTETADATGQSHHLMRLVCSLRTAYPLAA
jgi:hypothetical protein